LTAGLTPEEQQQLTKLNQEIANLRSRVATIAQSRVESESQMKVAEQIIAHNLQKKKNAIEQQLSTIHLDPSISNIDQLQEEQAKINSMLNENKIQLETNSKITTEKNKALTDLKKKTEQLKTQELEHSHRLQDESKNMEKILNQRSLYLQKREECLRKIRELGSLPADAFEEHKTKTIKELMILLHKCNEKLKGFVNVNKKAYDQYINFTEQHDQLVTRKKELDQGIASIKELIQTLDHRKDEVIKLTFKQVTKYFSEVFTELVPGGNAALLMQRGQDGTEEEEGEIGQYLGVQIRVSFTGEGDVKFMQQLSGGQKSLVALALIFAIQRCDPAPFYLFDEIDAALDTAHQVAVAQMIKRQSEKAQFITTTFKPALVQQANKFYFISLQNKVSTIRVVTQDEALAALEP